MAITQPDLKHFLSEVVGTGATNGGRMAEVEAVTGVKNNVWPNVSADQRASGVTMYRKIFAAVRNVGSESLVSAKGWIHGPTPGADYVYAFVGTKTDTEADFNQTTKYAAASLKTGIAIGATSCVVTCENAVTTLGFRASGKVRISNQTTPSDISGDFEDMVLTATPPLISGLDVTLYFATGTVKAYLAVNTVVGSVMTIGTIQATTGTIVVTSAGGTVNAGGFAPVCYNKGTRDETLTVTFSTTTAFSVSGSRSGSLGSGTVSTDFTANNPINSSTLIYIPAGFFSATGFVALNTVSIPTIGCNFSYWEARVVPAGSASLNGNEVQFAYTGESG